MLFDAALEQGGLPLLFAQPVAAASSHLGENRHILTDAKNEGIVLAHSRSSLSTRSSRVMVRRLASILHPPTVV
jgi:hypothetical protein